MSKYVGISLVSVIGIVAIGVVAYSFHSLNEHIRNEGEASAASGSAPKHFVLATPNNVCTKEGPEIKLSWPEQDNATGYVVYRGEVGIPTSTAAIGYTTAANFVDTTADPLHSYMYRSQVVMGDHGTVFSTESEAIDVPVCSGTLSYVPLAPISMLASAHIALWQRSKNTIQTIKNTVTGKSVSQAKASATTAPKKTSTTSVVQPPFVFVPPAVVSNTPVPVTTSPTATPPITTPVAVSPVPVAAAAETPAPAASPSTMKWGVFAGDSNGNLTTVETMVGKKADIQAMFLNWKDEFPTSWFGTHLCPDRELLIFWENSGISLDSIIAGNYDAYLKKFSAGAQTYGCPVIMSLFHEMNGNWDTWGGVVGSNTPAKIIAAWRHVHGLMPASNIKWAWAVNNDSIPNTPENAADKYYPGDAYVDYVGVDGFSFAERWESFGSVFDEAIAGMQKYNKPLKSNKTRHLITQFL